MQYHEVRINFTFEGKTVMELAGVKTDVAPQATLWVDYVYLDTDERRRFAQVSHEYLIDQLQFTGSEQVTPSATAKTSFNIRLNYNHPCKFICWNFNAGAAKPLGWYAGNVANVGIQNENAALLYSAKLQLNGHDRFNSRFGSCFNRLIPYQTVGSMPNAGVYMYSFALRPEEHQPSGACNMSRIDNATMQLTLRQCSAANIANISTEDITLSDNKALTSLNIYAVNYNVLRIMSGIRIDGISGRRKMPVPSSELPQRFPSYRPGENSVIDGDTAAAAA